MAQLKLVGTTHDAILANEDGSLTDDRTFTFPNASGELLTNTSTSNNVQMDGLTVGNNAQPRVVINKAYGVFVKPVSQADGGVGTDSLWQGYDNDGSTITSKIRADGQLNLGTQDTNSNATWAKGIQALGSTGQLVVQGSSGETLGSQTMFAIYHGSSEKFTITNNGNVSIHNGAIALYNNGTIVSPGTYTTTSPNPRPMFVGNDGTFGGVSSVRSSKKNIEYDFDSSWVLDLKPVSFNYRKQDKETKAYTEESYEDAQYGLIAEDVEEINYKVCNYDGDKLLGVDYHKLITPILAQLQQSHARIEALEAEVKALKGGVS